MPNLAQNIEDAQRVIVDLLFTDLGLAFTFLETARVTSVPETRQRNVANAVKAYRDISEKGATLQLSSSTRQHLAAQLAELSQQLAARGESV